MDFYYSPATFFSLISYAKFLHSLLVHVVTTIVSIYPLKNN